MRLETPAECRMMAVNAMVTSMLVGARVRDSVEWESIRYIRKMNPQLGPITIHRMLSGCDGRWRVDASAVHNQTLQIMEFAINLSL